MTNHFHLNKLSLHLWLIRTSKTIDNRIDNLDIVIVIVHFGSYTNMLEEIGHLDKIWHHQALKVQFMARQDKGNNIYSCTLAAWCSSVEGRGMLDSSSLVSAGAPTQSAPWKTLWCIAFPPIRHNNCLKSCSRPNTSHHRRTTVKYYGLHSHLCRVAKNSSNVMDGSVIYSLYLDTDFSVLYIYYLGY